MTNIIATIDTIKKYRNTNEYRNVNRIRCEEFDIEIVGDHAIVKKLASILVQQNCDISRGLEVLRGDTPCFKIHPLKRWVTKRRQPPSLKSYHDLRRENEADR